MVVGKYFVLVSFFVKRNGQIVRPGRTQEDNIEMDINETESEDVYSYVSDQ